MPLNRMQTILLVSILNGVLGYISFLMTTYLPANIAAPTIVFVLLVINAVIAYLNGSDSIQTPSAKAGMSELLEVLIVLFAIFAFTVILLVLLGKI